MQHLIDAVRRAVQQENWYAALIGALTLPDIAGKLDERQGGSQSRYIDWYDQYLKPAYTKPTPGIGDHCFMSGRDCYALRCAFLHEGDFDITDQRAREVLERFHFEVSARGNVRHCVQVDRELVLNVPVFCKEVCFAVEAWLAARGSDPQVAANIAQMPQIRFV